VGHRIYREVVSDGGDGAGRSPVQGEIDGCETLGEGPGGVWRSTCQERGERGMEASRGGVNTGRGAEYTERGESLSVGNQERNGWET